MTRPSRVTHGEIAPIMLPVAKAAAYIGVSRSRLYELIAAGAIRKGKDGAKTLIWREDLDTWARQKVGILWESAQKPEVSRET